ncbi:MAG: MraY family glycosyltransferase [Verrucomicrobiota bacterium]|nr:undecaprenyl/decaprenyl-phosphate alpha-N-acetylglucosaminyl 1-phosphate transferase [Limisphaera sp.]MDW8382634.1 MraY family glycosyltransferase [Verrucomicrobiota bacterium]
MVCLLFFLPAVVAFTGTAISMAWWRHAVIHLGMVDDPGHRKIHTERVPLAGGLAVLTGWLLALVGGMVVLQTIWWDAGTRAALTYGLDRRAGQLLVMILGAVAMTLLGALDDRHELRPSIKFLGQWLVASAVVAADIRITLFVPGPLFSYVVSVLWILTLVNAFNFTDNMNGLCTGLGLIASWYFAVLAARQGQYLVAACAFAVCGALAGFLPWNFPRARAFLGDSGSHLVGYWVAVLAILPHFYSELHPRTYAVLSPLWILAVPLLDLVQVVINRWRRGQPFYVGDTRHLSHLLVRAGLSPTRAVLVLWFGAAATGAVALLW